MRNNLFILLLSLITIFAFSCEHKETSGEPFPFLVEEVKVLNAETRQIKIDNFAHSVFIEFGDGVDISNVEIQIKLAEGVSMVTPENSRAIFDFSQGKQSFTVKKGNTEITYRFKIKYAQFDPTPKGWQKTETWGTLPEYLSVYK